MRAIRPILLATFAVMTAARSLAAQPPSDPKDPFLREEIRRQAAECRPPPAPARNRPPPASGAAPLPAFRPHPYRVTGSTDPQASVREVVISEDGCLIAIHRLDRVLDVWSNREGRLLFSRPDTDWGGERTGMAFSPDGSTLAIAGQGGLLKVYNAATGALLAEMDGKPHIEEAVRVAMGKGIGEDRRSVMASVAFSPDNRRLVTTGNFGTVILWDLATRRARWARRMEPETPEPGLPGGHAVFVRDGRQIVVMGEERVQVVSAVDGDFVQPYPAPTGPAPVETDGPLTFTYSRPEEMSPAVDWPGMAVLGALGGGDAGLRWIHIANRNQLLNMRSFRVPAGFWHIALRPGGGLLAGMMGDTVQVYTVSGQRRFIIPPSATRAVTGPARRVLFGVGDQMYTVHDGAIPLLVWSADPT